MIITFQAFAWEPTCSKLTMDAFLKANITQNGILSNSRSTYIINEGQHVSGVILTIKDMRKFCKLVRNKQEVNLEIHQLQRNEQVADFNFFTIDSQSGYGMYQHYHHSCSLNTFNFINSKRYDAQRRELLRQRLKDIDNDAQKKKIAKSYTGKLEYRIIEREGTFIERVKAMNDVARIEFEFQAIAPEQDTFAPLNPFLRGHKHLLSFLKGARKKNKIRALTTLLTQNPLKKATVTGIDENGNDITYRLMNDFDRFATFEYEDFVPSLRLNHNDVHRSISENRIIAELKLTLNKIKQVLKKNEKSIR
ncbi:hypothetical protein DA2_2876 [Desulfovibrio sp. A2]|nr:hypothetical protein DA2_2876 [Desulfovibrio sp. A2]